MQQPTIYSEEIVSNLSGGTVSSNDEDKLAYDSHAQMRKLPPLTDESDDDEESGACDQDKYQTIEPNTSSNNSSKTEENSVPVVDAKKSTYRRSGLAAFRPNKSYESSLKNNVSDTTSTAGSSASEATTAITGHTRKSYSFVPSRRNRISTAKGSSAGTKRFAALKARVRVRKV